jgi:Flp pilus assembly protein TadD
MTTISVYSPVAAVLSPRGMYLTAQSPQMPSPALSVSSIVRHQTSAFAGQSPALTHRSLRNLQVHSANSPSTPGSAMNVGAQTRYRGDEEERLRNQIFEAEMSLASSSLGIPDMLYELGGVLVDQGRYKAAEDIIRRLVGGHESDSSSGGDNAETLKALDLLGRVLDRQGLHVKAERLFRRALQRRKDVLGLRHPDTLASMNNLAHVLGSQGRYTEAESIHRQELECTKRVLGPEHPDTLTSMNNLAVVLERQGKYEEAESMHRQTLAICE